ncbi:ketol-acid reductoisomerase [Ornithinimicrobium humiphilum]|uniref:Ketol-acid reductoisomerase n=1 Tax=Ornithinimicrobium humiphilum TaxID=125288 RepID=A0A543KLU0_9MICO|nr:ketol-acid reductoisomerase [Ornithinimicrobium humiphilum]TQM96030.1 ketol-acid reductoisomerase [Ornithinimicrobium humiphilum]
MSTVLDPDSADLTLLQDRQVAVLGYDAVAEAHALNLRDSGVDVWVGIDPDSRRAVSAEIEGLTVRSPEEAVAHCDIVLVPAADDHSPGPATFDLEHLQRLLDEHTEPGDLVIVTSGAQVLPGALSVPEGVDLALLRAVGDGQRIREEFLDGRGCPALVAVARDGSGAAWATLTAYAAAMGSLRSGAIVTTVEHQATALDLAEEWVHVPLRKAVEAAFDELVRRGVEDEVAYLAVVHDLKTRVDQINGAGFASQYGPAGHPIGGSEGEPLTRRAAARAAHPLEHVGRRVRAMMSWIR